MKNSIIKIINNKRIYFVLGILLILAIWQISSIVINNDIVLPSVFETLKSVFGLLKIKGTYLAIFTTFKRLIFTIIICFILSIVLCSLSTISKKVEEMLKPTITSFKTLPVVVVLLLIWFVFGRNYIPYLVTGLVVLPIMYEGILVGINGIDKNILEELKMDSKTNFYIIYKIYLPLAFPYLISSLVQSIGLGLKVMVMAEYISMSKNTIGYKIYYYAFYEIETKMVFAWAVILVIFILIIDSILKAIRLKFVN